MFICLADPSFQFHKGTIKPAGIRGGVLGGVGFQFHKGTIKPPLF